MTVADTASEVIFIGDGVTTSFEFTFRVDDLSWLVLSFNTNLDAIVLNGDQDADPGGVINYLAAPDNGQLINIQRLVPRDQTLNYTRYGPFDSEATEDTLDKIVMMIQDAERSVARKSKSVTIESPLVGDDLTLYFTFNQSIITKVRSVLVGSGSVTWLMRKGSDRNALGTEVISDIITSNTTGDETTVFNDPSLAPGDWVWLEITAVFGSIDSLHLTIELSDDVDISP